MDGKIMKTPQGPVWGSKESPEQKRKKCEPGITDARQPKAQAATDQNRNEEHTNGEHFKKRPAERVQLRKARGQVARHQNRGQSQE